MTSIVFNLSTRPTKIDLYTENPPFAAVMDELEPHILTLNNLRTMSITKFAQILLIIFTIAQMLQIYILE